MIRRALVVMVVALAALMAPAAVASAHPLGNFTINLYSGLRVVPGEIRIDYVIDMAEIPTFQEMSSIDANGDGSATSDERNAWAGREAPVIVANLSLSVDGREVPLEIRSTTMGFRPGQGGLPILRFECTFVATGMGRAGRIVYRDGNFADHIGWREITATGTEGEALAGSTVPVRSVSEALLAYPQDLLSNPLRVTSMTASFHPGESAGAGAAGTVTAASEERPGVASGAFPGLIAKHGPALILLAIALAAAFGAWHAILPGHGKTLMAAYMVGSDARVRQAIGVGTAVAVMHTSSVLGLGLLVLSLARTFRPELLYPWLGLVSGLVALGLGAYLLLSRLAAWSSARAHDRAHAHGHDRGHTHGHDRGHTHAHELPDGVSPTSRKGLFALALAGGILPSPSALIVLLAAIEVHRVAYGLALIGAFSLGLAGALIGIGLGALRAREAMTRRLSSFWGRLVPVLSAGAIVAVGGYLAVRGAVQI